MFANAFESVKRRYFGDGAARPGTDGGASDADGDARLRRETSSTDGATDSLGLSPDEEILQLLEARDGRIEQGDVVEALPWSPATVSRRLGQLEAEGEVVRFPVGRRKIVCRPDCTPAAVRSPFEA